MDSGETKRKVDLWRIQKLRWKEDLGAARGRSMVSIAVCPGSNKHDVIQMLAAKPQIDPSIIEYFTTNLEFLCSAQRGFVAFVGLSPSYSCDGSEALIKRFFCPVFALVRFPLLACADKFCTELALTDVWNQLKPVAKNFGFVVLTRKEALIGILGGERKVIQRSKLVGQNSMMNFLCDVLLCDTSCAFDNYPVEEPRVSGVIVASARELWEMIATYVYSGFRRFNLQAKIKRFVEIEVGGDFGFECAINQSAGLMPDLPYIQEKRIICELFGEMNKETDAYVVGASDTIRALKKGLVKTLIIWDDVEITDFVMKNRVTGRETRKWLTKHEEENTQNFQDDEDDTELEVCSKVLVSVEDEFVRCVESYGHEPAFVTGESGEGRQFCRGMGGIGAILCRSITREELDCIRIA